MEKDLTLSDCGRDAGHSDPRADGGSGGEHVRGPGRTVQYAAGRRLDAA